MSTTQAPTTNNVKQSNGVTFTGSTGAAVEISSVRLSIGNNDVMSDVNWTILPKERWALVGRNGAGKSTLLRAITGTGGELVSISEGGISIAKKARMGYLEQKGVSGSVMTVRQEVSSRMDRLTAATAALDKAEAAVSGGDTSEEMLIELEEASVEFEAAGGYTVEQKISNVLKGLGFIEEDYDRFVFLLLLLKSAAAFCVTLLSQISPAKIIIVNSYRHFILHVLVRYVLLCSKGYRANTFFAYIVPLQLHHI
jgi:ABC transporter